MADKDGDLAARIIGGVAALAAAYVTRKALTLLWTKAVGKEPPADPSRPTSVWGGTGLGRAHGVGMEVTRVLAVRTVHKRLAARAPRAPERPQR